MNERDLSCDTFHLEVVCLSNVKEVVAFANSESVFEPLFVDERYPQPAWVSSQIRAGSVC